MRWIVAGSSLSAYLTSTRMADPGSSCRTRAGGGALRTGVLAARCFTATPRQPSAPATRYASKRR